MVIKSQQDVKNETKARAEKIPRSMEKLGKPTDGSQIQKQVQKPGKELSDSERITYIEEYLKKADAAFEKIANELDAIRNITKALTSMDAEISKITGDFIRLTKLEEDRYIEIVTFVNQINEKVTTIDNYLPTYVTDRLNEYFEESEEEALEQLPTADSEAPAK